MTPRRAHGWVAVTLVVGAACAQAPVDGSPAPSSTPITSASTPAAAASSPAASADAADGARADLEKLTTFMEKRHPDLFRDMTPAEWRAAVDRLAGLIPELVPDQPERLYVEFLRLVAMPGVIGGRHGHTGAWPVGEKPQLGIVTYTFADGIYVTRALPPDEDLVGSRITAVAGRPIDEVRALIEPLIPQDNEWTPEIWFTNYLASPEVLAGLDIIDAVGPVALTVEMSDGRTKTVEVGLVRPTDLAKLDPPSVAWLPADFARDVYLPERPGALWTSRMDEALWWTTLHAGATLYVQLNLFEPPPPRLLAEILEAARAPAIERVILDLRHNMGGDDDGGMLQTLRDEAIDQPGRLFVITSTNVFSATPPVVSELDRTTNAVIVGEPIGGAPTAFWGGSSITLDRLPIPLTVEMPRGPLEGDDRGLTVEPDIAVPLNGFDYFGDHDAAMAAILAAKAVAQP